MPRWVTLSATAFMLALLSYGGASAQSRPQACDKSKTPQKMDAEVVRIDKDKGKVTVRASDGTTHEFQASKETLQEYKVGDRIEATLRSAPNC